MSAVSQTPRVSWLHERRHGIGGSDAAAVLNLSPWKSALELYCDKIGLNSIEDAEPDWLYWGKALEPIVAARYEQETKRSLMNLGDYEIIRSQRYPWMCCTIDRSILGEPLGILSIKNVVGFKKSEWADEPPVEYQIQLQHEMIVLDRTWGSFAVLFNGHDFGWYDVKRNDRFCAYLIEEERKFWDRVLNQDPPEAGRPFDSCREALARLYPSDNGETVSLDGEIQAFAEELETLKKSRSDKEEKIDELEARIRAAIGDATIGVCPNGMAFSLKTVKKAAYTVKPQEYRQLRRLKTK